MYTSEQEHLVLLEPKIFCILLVCNFYIIIYCNSVYLLKVPAANRSTAQSKRYWVIIEEKHA